MHPRSRRPTAPTNAERYLQQIVGNRADAKLRAAFLKAGPEAVEVLENNSEVKLRAYPRHPDYRSELEGAVVAGRALEPLPFDGRLLGDALRLVRPPIPEFTLLGGMMVDRTDIGHLLSAASIDEIAAAHREAAGAIWRATGWAIRGGPGW